MTGKMRFEMELTYENGKLWLKPNVNNDEIKFAKYYVNGKYVGMGHVEDTFSTEEPSNINFSVDAVLLDKHGKKVGKAHRQVVHKDIHPETPVELASRDGERGQKISYINSFLDTKKNFDVFMLQIPATCKQLVLSLKANKNADYNIYGAYDRIPTTINNDWASTNKGDDTVNVPNVRAGKLFVRIQRLVGTGSYRLEILQYFADVAPPAPTPPSTPTPWNGNGKYAIIVGISDYKTISDLSFCDEDATNWYNYLTSLGYQCKVYGDPNVRNYPRYDGLATENTVRKALTDLFAYSKETDKIAFITSGHGSGDGKGNSFLCMYECGNNDVGCYWDKELNQDFKTATAKPQIFMFVDHCFSGGLTDNLRDIPNLVCLTTCTENGYGYDQANVQNGAWTFCFLQHTLLEKYRGTTVSVQDAFTYAKNVYPTLTGNKDKGDQPTMMDSMGKPMML